NAVDQADQHDDSEEHGQKGREKALREIAPQGPDRDRSRYRKRADHAPACPRRRIDAAAPRPARTTYWPFDPIVPHAPAEFLTDKKPRYALHLHKRPKTREPRTWSSPLQLA